MKSESSTTSDNTTEFIDIVKKYDVVYNNHNPDYKNVDVKMKVWSQIAEEIGLSVDASKRKWKNLRDSYTKYLRSFRVGTKTSKKYQFWAHAEHMDFLKPYQGPGRNSSSNGSKTTDDDDTECDLGFQVLAKASTTAGNDEDAKSTQNPTNPTTSTTAPTLSVSTASSTTSAATTTTVSAATSSIPATTSQSSTLTTASSNGAFATPTATSASLVLPVPSLPTVQLPPQLSGKSMLGGPLTSLSTTLPPAQIYPMPQIATSATKTPITGPASSTTSSVGCLILEPQLFSATETFKKETSGASSLASMGPPLYNIATPVTATAPTSRGNPPLITKIRRVQPSPQISASSNVTTAVAQPITTPTYHIQPPPAKTRKIAADKSEMDISVVLQANRELDSNTLFFLSLARAVRAMPMKFQSLAKMRCMRIISDIELELDNVDCNGSMPSQEDAGNSKFSNLDTPPPPDGSQVQPNATTTNDAAGTEHFVYCMSPSRVESMIDISSDEDAATNGS